MKNASPKPAADKPHKFKLKETVRYSINTRAGLVEGTGTIKHLPPKDAPRGANRFEVFDAENNKTVKPYPSQVSPVTTSA